MSRIETRLAPSLSLTRPLEATVVEVSRGARRLARPRVLRLGIALTDAAAIGMASAVAAVLAGIDAAAITLGAAVFIAWCAVLATVRPSGSMTGRARPRELRRVVGATLGVFGAFGIAGVVLDLGATAKAVAADRSARTVAERLGCGVLVGLGGDIATAGAAPDGGWQVDVQDTEDDPGQRISLQPGWSLATSSTQKRRWRRSGAALHHILDPRTLWPAAPVWRSVSVAAPSCELANTWSTAAIVYGGSAPERLARADVSARLVGADREVWFIADWPEAA